MHLVFSFVVPVDVLVDIDGLGDRLLYSPALSHQDDDPFELCSMHSQSSQMDLGLELGLALEKSIKLRSQSTSSETPVAGIDDEIYCQRVLTGLCLLFSYTKQHCYRHGDLGKTGR